MSAEPRAAGATYLDSSALVKLAVDEAESPALRAHLRTRVVRVSCALARVEVPRAVRQGGPAGIATAHDVLQGIRLVRLDDALLDDAAALTPPLRSLDAVHLAAARSLGDDLLAVVTYDRRMASAARELGLRVEQPA